MIQMLTRHLSNFTSELEPLFADRAVRVSTSEMPAIYLDGRDRVYGGSSGGGRSTPIAPCKHPEQFFYPDQTVVVDR